MTLLDDTRSEDSLDVVDPILGARFVWPAEVLHQVAYGGGEPSGYKSVVARSYFLVANGGGISSPVSVEAKSLTKRLAVRVARPRTEKGWSDMLLEWQRCVDGHRLWSEMEGALDDSLAYGWLLENFHYLGASPLHVGAAVASCPDVALRASLVKHLAEESGHERMLLSALSERMPKALVVSQRRPSTHRLGSRSPIAPQ